MFKISPIVVILSLVTLIGFILVAIRENGAFVGLAIIAAASIFLTCFLFYFAEQYISLVLK